MGPQRCLVKKNLVKKIMSSKHFGSKKIVGQKTLGPKQIVPNKILVQNIYQSKQILNPKYFWSKEKVGTKMFRLGVPSKKNQYIYRHCPNRREGGQPHFKKIKNEYFLTKVAGGGGHKTYCQK